MRLSRFAWAAAVPLLLLVVGTLGYHVVEGWAYFDALYMTAITLTTVGYGETHPLSQAGRVFTIFLAFGGVGNPIRVLVAVTGLPEADLSAMVGRILPATALVLPFWLVRTMTGWRNVLAVWPGCLACGAIFGLCQFYWSNFQDASLVDIIGGMVTLAALAFFFKMWRPAKVWHYPTEPPPSITPLRHTTAEYEPSNPSAANVS